MKLESQITVGWNLSVSFYLVQLIKYNIMLKAQLMISKYFELFRLAYQLRINTEILKYDANIARIVRGMDDISGTRTLQIYYHKFYIHLTVNTAWWLRYKMRRSGISSELIDNAKIYTRNTRDNTNGGVALNTQFTRSLLDITAL